MGEQQLPSTVQEDLPGYQGRRATRLASLPQQLPACHKHLRNLTPIDAHAGAHLLTGLVSHGTGLLLGLPGPTLDLTGGLVCIFWSALCSLARLVDAHIGDSLHHTVGIPDAILRDNREHYSLQPSLYQQQS